MSWNSIAHEAYQEGMTDVFGRPIPNYSLVYCQDYRLPGVGMVWYNRLLQPRFHGDILNIEEDVDSPRIGFNNSYLNPGANTNLILIENPDTVLLQVKDMLLDHVELKVGAKIAKSVSTKDQIPGGIYGFLDNNHQYLYIGKCRITKTYTYPNDPNRRGANTWVREGHMYVQLWRLSKRMDVPREVDIRTATEEQLNTQSYVEQYDGFVISTDMRRLVDNMEQVKNKKRFTRIVHKNTRCQLPWPANGRIEFDYNQTGRNTWDTNTHYLLERLE